MHPRVTRQARQSPVVVRFAPHQIAAHARGDWVTESDHLAGYLRVPCGITVTDSRPAVRGHWVCSPHIR